jgi:hypothetical protein
VKREKSQMLGEGYWNRTVNPLKRDATLGIGDNISSADTVTNWD